MSWPPVSTAMSSSMALRRSPKPGRLHRRDFEAAAQLVDHERRQRFAFDVLGDDKQRPARLHHRLEHREQRLQPRQLLLVQQHVSVLELGQHLLGIGDEVGREIAAVELHALDDLDVGLQRFRFLDRDHAFVADLLHRLGDHLADCRVAVGGDGAGGRAYAAVGVDALLLIGVNTRKQLDAIAGEIGAPLFLGQVTAELSDLDYLTARGVRIALQGHFPFFAMIRAVNEVLQSLRRGTPPSEIKSVAEDTLVKSVSRDADYRAWLRDFMGGS